MIFMKYFFTIFLLIFLLGKTEASLNSKEIQKLYLEGKSLLDKDVVKADSIISLAWSESRKAGDSKGIADGYFYKGCLFERESQVDMAVKYLNKANTLYHLINEWENVPDSYGRLGSLLIKMNKPEEGLKHLLEALKLAEELKNPQALIRNTIVLANHLNEFAGQYDDAIRYLKEAEKSAKKLHDKTLLGSVYLQLSASHLYKRDYGEAIENSILAYDEFVFVGSSYNQMSALFALANVYEKTKQSDEILHVLSKIRPLLKQNSDNLMKSNYYRLLAETYYEQDDFKKALSYAEYAATLLRESGVKKGTNNLDEILFRLHYILGNKEIADSLYVKYNAARDSSFSLSSLSVDAELRKKFEVEKRTQQIDLQTLELENAKFLRRGLFGVIVFAIILCIVIYGRLREKARNEHLLALKNDKIERQYVSLRQMNEYNETLLREIHHRVKNNIQIISSLFSIQARDIDHPAVLNLIEKSKSRLKTISIIHNTLYTQKSLSKIKMSDFIKEIGESLFDIYNVENSFEESLRLHIKGDSVYLNADTSLPLGLVINELITNSLKYAFKEGRSLAQTEAATYSSPRRSYYTSDIIERERDPHRIEIGLNKVSASEFALIYTDSGPGLDSGIDIQTAKSTGLRLIRGLLQQLNGTISYESKDNSHQFVIVFREVD